MKRYSVGFIFNSDLSKVLLVHKISPEWQIGKINGIGGKLEIGESGLDCIIRETKEESGLETKANRWSKIGILEGGAIVEIFAYIYKGDINDAKKTDKEEVEWFEVNNLPTNIIPNLQWMIPLSLEKMQFNKVISFKINYKEF